MYAIVEIAGQQYKVQKDQQLFVHRLEGKEGSKVTFDNVLLTANGDKIEVGAPAVKGVAVSAKIIEHLKGDKTIVFKKKRRKGYAVKNGHRQLFSKIEIEKIGAATKSTTTKAEKETVAKDTKTKASTSSSSAAKKAKTTSNAAKKTAAEKSASTTSKTTKTKAATKPQAKAKPATKKVVAKPKAKTTTAKKTDKKDEKK